LSRAYQERFFPGSTFKVVTAAAGIESGELTEDRPSYASVANYTPPGTTRPISNFGGGLCGGTLFTILAKSCNSSFAQMAIEQIGRDGMVEAAEAVGFNAVPPIDLTRPAESVFPTDLGDIVERPEGRPPIYSDAPTLAQSAIGQNDVSATPLQMALVAAAVANEGTVMVPHVMSEIRASDNETVERFDVRAWREAMAPDVAEVLRRAMVGVVEEGSARTAAIPGVEVGAKTGTAQLGTDPPRSHAWMIAFAGPPGEPPTVAVAVMMQEVAGDDGQTGGRVAGPRVNDVLTAALAVL
jgi:peptidoglycan glycosyltransferase